MALKTPPRGAGNVVSLLGRSAPTAPRTIDLIRADLAFHTEAMRVLLIELLAAETGRPNVPHEHLVSLKEASRKTGWRVPRIKDHIVRRATHHPELPQLGFQPGDVANSPWFVNLDALVEYIQGRGNVRK